VSTRDISYYRDPAVILIDQLKEISLRQRPGSELRKGVDYARRALQAAEENRVGVVGVTSYTTGCRRSWYFTGAARGVC
jgi:hypothetical protein